VKHNTRQSALEEQVKDRITVMFSKEDHIRALTCLEAIGKYYPAFVDHFFVRIFGQLKRFISEAKVIALRLVLLRLDDIEDPFAKLQPRLSELIRHRDEEAQLVTLQIVFQLLPRVEEAQISKFITDLLETFAAHPNEKCRVSTRHVSQCWLTTRRTSTTTYCCGSTATARHCAAWTSSSAVCCRA
jgi:hypothetical protein